MSRVKVATIEVFAELGSPIQVVLEAPGPVPTRHVTNARKVDVAAAREVEKDLRGALVQALYDALQAALPHTRR